MTHVIHKPIERGILSMPVWWNLLFVFVVTVVFVYDSVICVREALAFGKSLEAMRKLKGELDSLNVQKALLKMEARDRIAEMKERADAKFEQLYGRRNLAEIDLVELKALAGGTLDNLRDLTEISLEGLRDKTEQQVGELLKQKEAAMASIKKTRPRFRRNRLHGNPSAVSRHFAQEFKDLKEYLEKTGKGQSPL